MQYLTHMGVDDSYGGYGMMGGIMGGGPWSWFAGLTWIVWLIVGILLIVWLWKQINK